MKEKLEETIEAGTIDLNQNNGTTEPELNTAAVNTEMQLHEKEEQIPLQHVTLKNIGSLDWFKSQA